MTHSETNETGSADTASAELSTLGALLVRTAAAAVEGRNLRLSAASRVHAVPGSAQRPPGGVRTPGG